MIKTLIVDDEVNAAATLGRSLNIGLCGKMDLATCTTAEKALQLLAVESFDLLVSDWHLPGLSGLVLISRARKMHPNIRIVFMTAMPDADLEERIRSVVDIYMVKPFKAIELAKQIQTMFGGNP